MQNHTTFSITINFTIITSLFPSGTLEDGKSLYFMDLKIDTKSVKFKPYLLQTHFAVNGKI